MQVLLLYRCPLVS